ncbi:DNA double-strand break repair nuclease NurA [Thermocrinis sp.]
MKYRLSLRAWEVNEMESIEYEESEQFAGLAEEERIYSGCLPEGDFTIAFVDGVRRIDYTAYVWDDVNKASYEGIFATIGAGAILLKPNSLNLLENSLCEQTVKRVFAVNGDLDKGEFKNLDYQIEAITDREISLGLLGILREEEAKVARKVWTKKRPHLIVCDGTLKYRIKGANCVGFIKTIKKLFLNKEQAYLLQELKKGERTPIIRVHHQTKVEEREESEKYTWYVKLSDTEGMGSLARIEIFKEQDFEKIRRIANLTAGILPLFASTPFQDPRSPQNLLPIRVLENMLRKYLGVSNMARRKLQEAFLNA